jgi:HEAT repeat protein
MQRKLIFGGLFLAGLALASIPSISHGQYGTFLGKSPADWAKDLAPDKDAKARRNAAFALGKLGGSAYVSELLRVFKNDGDSMVQDAAAFALGEICKKGFPPPEAPQILDEMQKALLNKNKADLVRRSAAYAMGCLAYKAKYDTNVLTALDTALTDTSPAVKQTAAWALGEVGPSGVKSLIKALSDGDPLVIRNAATALTRADKALSAHPEQAKILSALIPKITHPDTETKKAVVLAVIKVGKPGDAPLLAGPLQAVFSNPKEDRDIRGNAAIALANVGGPEAASAAPVLLDVLKGDELGMKRQAAALLGNIGKPAVIAVDELLLALENMDPELRENAATSLGGIGASMSPVKKMGEPEDPERPKIIAAIPKLIDVFDNPAQPFEVRRAAVIAVKEIGPTKDGPSRLLDVLVKIAADRKNSDKLRAFALWPVRFYPESATHQKLLDTLSQILTTETPNESNKDLRYDSAFLLSKYQQAKVSDKVLDTLLEFLKDEKVYIATGTSAKTSGGKGEDNVGKAGVDIEKGGDGRIIAISGLAYIAHEESKGNKQKLLKHGGIVPQLKILVGNPKIDPQVKKHAEKLLEYLGV